MTSYTHKDAIEFFKHIALDRSGYITDESSLSDKSILKALQESRSIVISAALETGRDVSEYCVQTLPCVSLTEVDRADCACAPASGCYWLKTDQSIPHTIRIISVTGIVANTENPRFQYLKWDRFQYIPQSRSISVRNGLYWSMKNTKDKEYEIYIYGNRFLKSISISAIFEDPISAAQFPRCGVKDMNAICNPYSVDFYSDSWMRDQIFPLAFQKILPVRQTAEADLLNNDRKD